MQVEVFLGAAALLGIERACYVWAWRAPTTFDACLRLLAPRIDPVDALQYLFYGFKVIQAAVFVGWCAIHAGAFPWPPDGPQWSTLIGTWLIAVGQLLNIAVFYRLGRVGVFYGNRFGYVTVVCRDFPFSVLNHPQYVGAVLSIWGFFLVMRFPNADWLAIPLLETAYYVAGAHLER